MWINADADICSDPYVHPHCNADIDFDADSHSEYNYRSHSYREPITDTYSDADSQILMAEVALHLYEPWTGT